MIARTWDPTAVADPDLPPIVADLRIIDTNRTSTFRFDADGYSLRWSLMVEARGGTLFDGECPKPSPRRVLIILNNETTLAGIGFASWGFRRCLQDGPSRVELEGMGPLSATPTAGDPIDMTTVHTHRCDQYGFDHEETSS